MIVENSGPCSRRITQLNFQWKIKYLNCQLSIKEQAYAISDKEAGEGVYRNSSGKCSH